MRRLFALLMLVAGAAHADDTAGEFDYYVMALSWSANWCAIEGDARGAQQCKANADYGWILHGLWPQYERGYPANCRTTHRAPSRSQTAEMSDIMGSAGLAWHQWRKHGVCTGLTSDDYFALSRLAYDRLVRPPVFRRIDRDITVPAQVIEDAFLADNPGLLADQITITCKDSYIQEARICLTRDLEFRTCGPDVIRDCTLRDARFAPMR
ncbi:ribonuclease T2 [Yoonia tamlensis]|uniref:Ribonuclease T2 n=1 Tax=Yoonia tamlensis TaxID=390270 RepID=A0A1I6GSQ6_9RHOB|nr:ribonuclease T2 [Yoonia tamlensis]SFR45208.1 ribonuclease T2 [Yoonia tamlensis]